MLEIKIERFEVQDIITASVAETRPPHEITLPADKCYCSVYGCNGEIDLFPDEHEALYQDPIGKGFLVCNGNNGVHSCGK